MSSAQRCEAEGIKGPALVTLHKVNEIYVAVYNAGQLTPVEDKAPLAKLAEIPLHLKREWRMLLLASLCGVALTLGILTVRSSLESVPESRVTSNAQAQTKAAAAPAADLPLNKLDEGQRLRARNRELEALVQVLRERALRKNASQER